MTSAAFSYSVAIAIFLLADSVSATQKNKPVVEASSSSAPTKQDGGPSLEVTMKFIEEKLSRLVDLNYTDTVTDGSDKQKPTPFSWAIRNVSAEASDCRLSWREDSSILGQHDSDNIDLSLRDVEKLQVITLDDMMNLAQVRAGYAKSVHHSSPQIFNLVIKTKQGVKIGKIQTGITSEEHALRFTDPEMADRVAKAITHAIELCGGGSSEPF